MRSWLNCVSSWTILWISSRKKWERKKYFWGSAFLNNFRRHRTANYCSTLPVSVLVIHVQKPDTGTMCPVPRINILISRIVKVEIWYLHLVVTRKPRQLSGEIRFLQTKRNIEYNAIYGHSETCYGGYSQNSEKTRSGALHMSYFWSSLFVSHQSEINGISLFFNLLCITLKC